MSARVVWRFLRCWLGRRPRILARFAAASLLEALPAFLSGRLVALAIDDGFMAGRVTTGLGWLGLLAAAVLVGAWGNRLTYLRLATLVEPFRDDLVELVVGSALQQCGAQRADSAAVARLTHQVEIVRESFATVILIVQSFVVTTVSALLGLLTLVPAVLVLVLPPLLAGLGLFLGVLVAMAARQRTFVLAGERIAETASTVATGLRDVTACGAEETVQSTAGRHIDAQAQAAGQVARCAGVRALALAIAGWLPLLLLLVAAPMLLRQGASAGVVLGAVTYVMQGLQPALRSLGQGLGNSGLWLVVALGRILDASGSLAATTGPAPQQAARPHGHDLELTGVTFGYGTSARPVIQDLDLAVPNGDHLAIVGPSGAGKSTLANLLTGMLEPQAGSVSVGGVPLHRLGTDTVRDHRVLIPQQAYVFAGTLEENVTYLRPEAMRQHVDEAVRAVGAVHLIDRLGGYQVEIDPGTLSAGERQLITLARAYLSPARLVVLDEATCFLDPAAEQHVELAFAHRPGTLVVIAHRMSSALRARRIVVFDGHQPLLGSHHELLDRSPLYRDLVGHWDAHRGRAAPSDVSAVTSAL